MKHVSTYIDLRRYAFMYTLTCYSEIPEGLCRRQWTRLAADDILLSVQVSFRPTFLGVIVSRENKGYGEQYLRYLVTRGSVWDCNRTQHILIDLRDNTPQVYRTRFMVPSSALSRALIGVHAALMHEMHCRKQKHEHMQMTYEKICEHEFFRKHISVKPHGNTTFAMAHCRGSDACVVVCGDIEECDAVQISRLVVQQKSQPVYDLLKGDNALIQIMDGVVSVVTERETLSSEQAGVVKAYVQYFLSLVVVSDTQMGGEKGRDFFGHDKEKDFMRLVTRCIDMNATLVINGDFLGFDIKRGNTFFAITKEYAPVFSLMKKLRRIVYVVGNHDSVVLSDDGVRDALIDLLPNCEICQAYECFRGNTRFHFEHGHMQTGVYQKWYTSLLFTVIDACHDMMASIKIACTRNKLHFPGVHILYYVTGVLLALPRVCQLPVRFFTRRELSRALALVAVYAFENKGGGTTVCCGHIHNLIGPQEGWVNEFLHRMVPQARYMNSGAWNASILQDELFCSCRNEPEEGFHFLDWHDPVVKKDWIFISHRGVVSWGAGGDNFLHISRGNR